MTPPHVMEIGQVPGVVRVGTPQVHDTFPFASACLGASPGAVLGPESYVAVIVQDDPGGAPSTTTVAVDPGDVAIVTDETLITGAGTGEDGADVVAFATGEDVAAVVGVVMVAVRPAAADAAGVTTGLGVAGDPPPHAAAATINGAKIINDACRTTNLRYQAAR